MSGRGGRRWRGGGFQARQLQRVIFCHAFMSSEKIKEIFQKMRFLWEFIVLKILF
jgi:hypothetical protein